MELFMTNIDSSLSRAHVVEALASILHQAPFDDLFGKSINFDVHLHRPRQSFQNRTGTLTLPQVEIGDIFLDWHSRIRIGSRDANFRRSRKPARPAIVDKIRRFPYINPLVEEKQKEQLGEGAVRVNAVQFGWLCRDYAFSIESEHHSDGYIDFRSEREMRITISIGYERYSIAIASSSINHLSASRDGCAVVLELNTPPSFELEPEFSDVALAIGLNMPEPPCMKLSYLPIPNHKRVAPFTSLMVRVICDSDQVLKDFRRLCEIAQFSRVENHEYHIVRRELFSVTAMSAVQRELEGLDWPVAFQIESLLRSMAIDYVEANQLIPEIRETLRSKGKALTAFLIRNFKNKVKAYFLNEDKDEASFDIVQLFRETVAESGRQDSLVSSRPTDSSIYESLHVEVTPTTMVLTGPFPERSNRVIRAYSDENRENFLRVSFVDEGGFHIRFNQKIDGRAFIRSRLRPLLLGGLVIAGRRFDFLAYSQSALKEHSVWFVQPFRDRKHGKINAAEIIHSLGTFDGLEFDPKLARCPARYAARIAQAFTATDAVKVNVERVMQIEDISTRDGKYKFTDGVGTISNDLGQVIWTQLNNRKRQGRCGEPPRAYQSRFGGSKGMFSVDYTLPVSTICMRPSMIKFEAPGQSDIEIARAFDRPGPCALNRPLIMLLEGLGVPFEVFEKYQDDAIRAAEEAGKSLKNAAGLLDGHGLGTSYRIPSILLNLEKLGIVNLEDDGFYNEMKACAINHVLRDLKNHARIPIPGAWTLVGVADVHHFLLPNTIFACIKPVDGEKKYLSGPVLISRSPCIHPGDVMIVEAIGAPPPGSCFAKEPLTNTVVFSVQGERPVPSCLGGGDLDGDLYNLIPLGDPDYKDLQSFKPTEIAPPASYAAAERMILDRPSTMEDVAEFFMEYISSDVVGIIAITWLIIADQRGIFDGDCMKLADLHSNAVDYPKSGRPVPLHEIPMLRRSLKPDWHAPETVQIDYESGDYYQSMKAIGRLFRSIDLPIEQQTELQRRGRVPIRMKSFEELEKAFHTFNPACDRGKIFSAVEKRVEELIGADAVRDSDNEQLALIASLFQCYAEELRALCMAYMVSRTSQLSESEMAIGTIAQKSSQPRRRKQAISKIREGTDILVRGIREELAGDDNVSAARSLQRAWMAWKFAVSQGKTFGAKSFGWIVLGAIFEAIDEVTASKDT